MAFPTPVPGPVIRYSYLWASEHARGQEEGVQDRPCAVVLTSTDEAGGQIVTVLPISHSVRHSGHTVGERARMTMPKRSTVSVRKACMAALGASVVAGVLWNKARLSATFGLGAGLTLLSVFLFLFFRLAPINRLFLP